jgi:hypothetical protein
VADGHAGGIFLQGNVATIVQAGFDASLSAAKVQ